CRRWVIESEPPIPYGKMIWLLKKMFKVRMYDFARLNEMSLLVLTNHMSPAIEAAQVEIRRK
ncbi:MAG: hypothetical protein KAW09_08045, partial [Thermoplasmata archaeon]|nr:hypothetical protein [Thermoplasmata archaeon]